MADEKVDYLDVDSPINGQNYCCISFLSPESVMDDKNAFIVSKFLQSICKSNEWSFDKVMKQYTDFTYKHEEALQKDYDEKNNFKTNVRGVKIRGVYQSKEEANARASKLHKTDSNFHVFVGQVGYWLPWDPTPDKIDDEHFGDDQLNDLMQKYKENNVNKDIFYEEQKRDKIKAAQEERLRSDRERKEREAKEALENVSEEPEPENTGDDEPCPEEPEPEFVPKTGPEDRLEYTPSSTEEPVGLNSQEPAEPSDLERALSGKDPWMQRQNNTD
jgi:hypothetical protein